MAYPHYIRAALEMVGYPDPFDHLLLDQFVQRWGGFDLDHLLTAIRQAPSIEDSDVTESEAVEERVFAMFAAASTGDERAREEIFPLLSSPLPNERWASAIGLGWLQDERALSMLFALLSEFLPPQLRFMKPGIPDWRYDDWREEIPVLLTRSWRRPAFTRPLQATLRYVLRLLRYDDPEAMRQVEPLVDDVRDFLQQNWMSFADTIIFALGRLAAFDTLAEILVPQEQITRWQAHMAMGALHDQHPALRIRRWHERPDVRDDVADLLQRQFGLDSGEVEAALSQYEDDMLIWYRIDSSRWGDRWN